MIPDWAGMAVDSRGKCPSNQERFNLWLGRIDGVSNAVLAARYGGCEIVRLFARAAVLLAGFMLFSTRCQALDVWGGSVALSSDYYVRGISRTSDHGALQLDFHYSGPSGFIAGLFASNTQIDPSKPEDVELSGFIGYAWSFDQDWRAKILASHYAYPWNRAGWNYNYDEIDLDVAYQGWLHFSVGYSPNSPRFIAVPYRSLIAVTEKSAEVSLQRQLVGTLSANAGVGYSSLSGPDSGNYTYWSLGAAYDFRSLTLALSYVNTTAGAKALFYNAAATGEWTGTVIWRF
jgi:uncharacterized protein (TIGR02001 family)